MGGETECITTFHGRFGNLTAGIKLGVGCLWLLMWSLLSLAWLVVLLLLLRLVSSWRLSL
jgi:hypothetical protein